MIVVGITGPIGSGKSYASAILSEYGIPSIDTDKVYHGLISEYTETVRELEAEFGVGIVNPDGSVNRAVLGGIVFSDAKKLERLNEITHKFVKKRTVELIEEYRLSGYKAIVLEVPLMFESGFDALCDEVVCVAADEQIRVERIMSRNGLSEKDAKKRIKNQKDIDFYIAKSSKVVYNNNHSDLRAQLDALVKEINK